MLKPNPHPSQSIENGPPSDTVTQIWVPFRSPQNELCYHDWALQKKKNINLVRVNDCEPHFHTCWLFACSTIGVCFEISATSRFMALEMKHQVESWNWETKGTCPKKYSYGFQTPNLRFIEEVFRRKKSTQKTLWAGIWKTRDHKLIINNNSL